MATRAWPIPGVAIAWLVSIAASARANEAELTLSIGTCLAADSARILQLLALEERRPVRLSAPGPRQPDLLVACDGPATVWISRRDGLMRYVDLALEAPEMRPRIVALTLAELLDAPAPLSESERPAEPIDLPRPSFVRPSSVSVGLTVRSFDSHPATLSVGPQVSYRHDWGTGWALDTSLSYLQSRHELRVGSVQASSGLAEVAFGPTWTSQYGSLDVAFGFNAGNLRLRSAASQEAVVAHDLTGFWGGPLATVLGTLNASDDFAVQLQLSGGWTAWYVDGRIDGDTTRIWRGAWFGATLALALTPDGS